MSLAIDLDTVTAVLLVDGWHTVLDKSFSIDAYEYVHEGRTVLGGGAVEGVPSTGFTFKEQLFREGGPQVGMPSGSALIAGPLTAILALRFSE
jgi:hypothetical protein